MHRSMTNLIRETQKTKKQHTHSFLLTDLVLCTLADEFELDLDTFVWITWITACDTVKSLC